MKNKGCFAYETANVKGEIRPKSAKFWRFSGPGGQGLEKVSFDFYCKRHIYTWIHVV